jgi:Family of unknown function (DUF6011)
MSETEYLGSQKINRSAHAVKTATATTAYLGICQRDNRPVRFEFPADLGPRATVPCFVCTLPVECERLHAVQTNLDCDGACRSARRPWCECGCGGVNHGRVWGQGALLDSREIVESEIAKYRDELIKIAAKREARAQAKIRAERNAFESWAADHAEIVQALVPWFEHRNEYGWAPKHWGSHILADFALQLHREHNRKVLTDKQVGLAERIFGEIAERDRREAERQAARAAKPGAGDQGQLLPGVYKTGGEVYVVKPNREYIAWRKRVKEAGAAGPGSQELQSAFAFLAGVPRPESARLYAKRLVERGERITKTGESVPAFSLEYAPGVIFDIALTDRLPLAEAREMSQRFRCCIYCGRTLDDPKSIAKGVGTDCVKYFGPVLREDAA